MTDIPRASSTLALGEMRAAMRIAPLLDLFTAAAKSLARSPGFTIPIAALLTLGIGAATVLWSMVYGVLLQPLPFPDPGRLVAVSETQQANPSSMSPSNFRDFAQQSTSFEALAAYVGSSAALSLEKAPAERIEGVAVTDAFFSVLGATPAAGRLLNAGDARAEERRVVLSHALWVRMFASDPTIVGRTLRLDGAPAQVIGVLSKGLAYPQGTEFWSALTFTEEEYRTQRGAHYLDGIGRLKAGTTVDMADAEMKTIADRLKAEYPKTNADVSASAQPLLSMITGSAKPTLVLLTGAVGVALLALCANLAGLTMARWTARARDLAVRGALGASRSQLATAIVAESVLLGIAGAALGALLARFALAAVTTGASLNWPRLSESGFGAMTGLGAAALAAFCGLFVGMAPALGVLGRDPIAFMGSGRASQSVGARRGRHGLVVLTCALAVVLVAAASLMSRSYARLAGVSSGFVTKDRISFAMSIPEASYPTPERRSAFLADLLVRLRALPSVEGVAATFGLPYGDFGYSISLTQVDGVKQDDATAFTPTIRVVTPGFFSVMGIPVRQGREFAANDRFGSAPVVVMNETAARRIFPGLSAVDRTLEIGSRLNQGRTRAGGQVVGVVADVREQRLHREPPAILYFVHDQFPVDLVTVVVAAPTTAVGTLTPAIREALRALDPDVPLFRLRSLDELRLASIATRLSVARVMNGFALAGLTLSMVGLFALLARMVIERRRELAIRLALGALAADLVRAVMGEAGRLVALGAATGLLLAIPLLGFARSLLYEVSAWDPASLMASVIVLFAGGLVAAFIPARRAARLHPAVVLKEE